MSTESTDLGRHLRTLVEACFEEGQYESGLGLLEQLREQKIKPYPSHVRQLICIALYPSSSTSDNAPSNDHDLLSSPRKLAKQSKAPTLPSPRASAMAHNLLTSYATTNTPAEIFRALPGYHQDPDQYQSFEEDAEGPIADQALSIKQLKTCWEFLTEDFRSMRQVSDARGRSRKGLKTSGKSVDASAQEPEMVCNNAWALLEWLISSFEHEEYLCLDPEVAHSSFLLHQIPPSRDEQHGARWATDTPLDIARYCLAQSDSRRRRLGARLLRLMINLTSTTEINFQMLVANTLARLISFPESTLDQAWTIKSTPVVLKFKLALCMKYITDNSSRTKTPVRAQPRAARPRGSETAQAAAVTRTNVTKGISAADVSQALQASRSDPEDDIYQWFKFQLVEAYDELQGTTPEASKDPDWNRGAIQKVVDQVFESEDRRGDFRAVLNVS